MKPIKMLAKNIQNIICCIFYKDKQYRYCIIFFEFFKYIVWLQNKCQIYLLEQF